MTTNELFKVWIQNKIIRQIRENIRSTFYMHWKMGKRKVKFNKKKTAKFKQ